MDAQAFLDELLNGLLDFVDAERAELAAFLQESGVIELTQHFIATGEVEQLEVIRFRVETAAARANVRGIREGSLVIQNLIGFAGRIAIGFLRPTIEEEPS